jgi:hypothetical protein
MSVGDLKDYGNKGNNFPWQLKMLKGLQSIITSVIDLIPFLNSIITNTNVLSKVPYYYRVDVTHPLAINLPVKSFTITTVSGKGFVSFDSGDLPGTELNINESISFSSEFNYNFDETAAGDSFITITNVTGVTIVTWVV